MISGNCKTGEILIQGRSYPENAVDFYQERQVIPNGFAPINIKNASYTWKTNKFKQKVFQYDLKWEMSNINTGR